MRATCSDCNGWLLLSCLESQCLCCLAMACHCFAVGLGATSSGKSSEAHALPPASSKRRTAAIATMRDEYVESGSVYR